MRKSEQTKENIIDQATKLIQEGNGNTEEITIRRIADRCNVGIGLINHYFGSKDKLFEICVQRIISGVIHSFRPEPGKEMNPLEITKSVTKQVMDFLMGNQQISKLSILGDLKAPEAMDNTMKTVMGFAACISAGKPSWEDKQNAFLLTAILQESFLRKDVLNRSLGIDFHDKRERDAYIDKVIDKVMGPLS